MAKRVLLVGVDELLAIELQKARFRNDVQIVDRVSTRRSALAVIGRRLVDVVLISNEWSEGNALKLASELAHRDEMLKVVLINAREPDQAALIDALEAGVSGCVVQPVDASTVVGAIVSDPDLRVPRPPFG